MKKLFSHLINILKLLNEKTKRDMVLWDGSCIVHITFSERELIKLKVGMMMQK